MKSEYISLEDLEVYRLARTLSRIAWDIYRGLKQPEKRFIGDQFLESTDSIGANIAEGYSRFHYMDKVKFLYNARGSLAESSNHWLELLRERGMVEQAEYAEFRNAADAATIKLQNFIAALYRAKQSQ